MPSNLHLPFWPAHAPKHLWVPETHLYRNVEVSALRFPNKPLVIFYDTAITYREFQRETEAIAGYLRNRLRVKKGDRVLLYMQNSPQFMAAFYGILRADAVVVPVNPMNLTQELRHYVSDSGAAVAFAAQELLPRLQPLLGEGLEHIVVATYSDSLRAPTDLKVPDFIAAPRVPLTDVRCIAWADMLAANLAPGPIEGGPDDLAVMPYTSGTTGHPKGCMHTHRTTMFNTASVWGTANQGSVGLSVLPMFHVTGMQANLNGADLQRRHHRAAAALGPRCRGVVHPALPRDRFGVDHRDGGRFHGQPEAGSVRPEQRAPHRRRRRGDARGAGRADREQARPQVRRGLRHVGDDGGHARQPARSAQAAMPRHPGVRRRLAHHRSRPRCRSCRAARPARSWCTARR